MEDVLPFCRHEASWQSVSLKFGGNPASTQRPFFWLIPTMVFGGVGVGVSKSDWDAEYSPKSSVESLSYLRSHGSKTVHRALINFGAVTDDALARLQREPGPENEIGLYPYDVGLQIGPVEVEPDSDDEGLVQIGWATITISGNGYCYPWTHQELIDRCLETELCAQARTSLLAIFGFPRESAADTRWGACSQRVRKLPDGLVVGIRGI
jgi:hypothetical protein